MNRSHLILILLVTLGVFAATTAAGDDAFVTTTDFSTGSSSSIDLATKTSTNNVAPIHSDATSRNFAGLVYVINRLGQDNVQRLDPDNGYATVNQFSTGNGSNPHDLSYFSSTRCYVTRYESTDLWEMNPATGAHTGTVSLAGLADADGIPEMDQMYAFQNNLFVTVQRLDRTNFFTPTATSYLAVIDMQTNTLVDTDPVAMGTQPITLANPNPFSEIDYDPATDNLYVSCVGYFGLLDGGVEMIDPLTYQSQGVIFTETAAGGDILDVEIVSSTLGYAIIATPTFVTNLISFNPQTGAKITTIYAPGDYVLNDIELCACGDLYLTDRTPLNPGVRCYNSATGVQITSSPISTGLPPYDITFVNPVLTGVSDTPAAPAALLPAYPNPFNPATTIPFTLTREAAVTLRIYSASGRFVRGVVDGIYGAGVHEARWDGRDAEGRMVRSGVYFARLDADGFSARRKLVLVK